MREDQGFVAEELGISRGESVMMAFRTKHVNTLLDEIGSGEKSTPFIFPPPNHTTLGQYLIFDQIGFVKLSIFSISWTGNSILTTWHQHLTAAEK